MRLTIGTTPLASFGQAEVTGVWRYELELAPPRAGAGKMVFVDHSLSDRIICNHRRGAAWCLNVM